MLLYIVRHAHAGQHGDPSYPNDDLRPLTKKGRKQFRRAIKKLAKRDFAPRLVATSPLVRCRQTAELIVEGLDDPPKLLDLKELAPGSDLASLISWTLDQREPEVAWVGHSPDVERLTAELIGFDSANITFAKGAIAAIEFPGEIVAGDGELLWLVTPKILGG